MRVNRTEARLAVLMKDVEQDAELILALSENTGMFRASVFGVKFSTIHQILGFATRYPEEANQMLEIMAKRQDGRALRALENVIEELHSLWFEGPETSIDPDEFMIPDDMRKLFQHA